MKSPRERLIIPFAALVGLGWAASLVVGLIEQSYVALSITTPALLLPLGYIFGVQIVRSVSNEKQE